MSMVIERWSTPSASPAPRQPAVVVDPQVWFTFEIEAGGLRRRVPDELASSMVAAGLDVSWTDTRSGFRGITRRFTVRGSRSIVAELIESIGGLVGWRPGAIALPDLVR